MLRNLFMTVLAAMVALPGAAADLNIDSTHSSVSFKIAHLVVSNVRGSFQTFEGSIHLDKEDITKSSVNVSIEVASITTANEKRDEHLRSPDFFDAEKHATITFTSTSVEKKGTAYVATGDLTIKGNTRQVSLPFQVKGPITDPWGNQRIGVQVEPITINRQDFGLTWSKTIEAGGLMVGNDVTIEIELEAVQTKSEPAG